MKFVIISLIILVSVFVVLLVIYDIRFHSDEYDILLRNRFTGLGFGVDYKTGLAVSIFAHTVHGGLAERHFYFDGFSGFKEGYK